MAVMRAYRTQQKVQKQGKRTIIATVKNRAVHRIRESEYLPLTSDRAAVRHKKTFSGPAAGKQRKRHKKETKIDNNGEIETYISSEQTEKVKQELRKTLLDCNSNQEQR